MSFLDLCKAVGKIPIKKLIVEPGYAVELEWLGNDSTRITKSITDFSELDNLPQPNINREYKFSWDANDLKTFKSTEELEQWKKNNH